MSGISEEDWDEEETEWPSDEEMSEIVARAVEDVESEKWPACVVQRFTSAKLRCLCSLSEQYDDLIPKELVAAAKTELARRDV